MWRSLIRPRRLVLLAITLLVSVTCIRLGIWQWHRLQERRAYNEEGAGGVFKAPTGPPPHPHPRPGGPPPPLPPPPRPVAADIPLPPVTAPGSTRRDPDPRAAPAAFRGSSRGLHAPVVRVRRGLPRRVRGARLARRA